MYCTIKCHCGCSVSLNEKNIKNISGFNCPVCNQILDTEYIDKIKQCQILINECKKVKHKQTTSNGFADASSDFYITFEF